MALELTSLFGRLHGKLFGREEETYILMERATRVYLHTLHHSGICANGGPQEIQQGEGFLCEVVLLSGYSSSGKTSLLKQLTLFFNANEWFVPRCKWGELLA
jgi:hypothetical protein